MLGRLHDKVDGFPGQPIDDGEVFGIEESAALILAELLDRAHVLWCLFAFDSADQMSDDERSMALQMFKRDCDEARARGERLGLLSEPHSWTENIGERALMGVSDKGGEIHPYSKTRWCERIERQIARRDLPEAESS